MKIPTRAFTFPVFVGQKVNLGNYPLLYQSYDIRSGTIGATACLFIISDEEVQLPFLLKMIQRLQHDLDKPCVFVSPRLSKYQMERLSEEGIAWIASSETMFIPFVGLALQQTELKKPVTKQLSSQAQRLATHIIDGTWLGLSTTDIAEIMRKSLPSISNYFKEIEAIAPKVFESQGRKRLVRKLTNEERRHLFEKLEPHLTSPVREKVYFRFNGDPKSLVKSEAKYSGVSALSKTTMLADDSWVTLAVDASNHPLFDAFQDRLTIVSKNDGPNLLIETWRYPIDTDEESVNKVSLYLSLRDNADDDPRLEGALHELKETIFT